jgi:hypothetical protein
MGKKAAIVTISHKTHILAVRLIRNREMAVLGNFPHVTFVECTQGKESMS